jgi:predicted esterase
MTNMLANLSQVPSNLFPPRHIFYPPSNTHQNTIIFIHERGSTGEQLSSHLNLAVLPSDKAIYDYFPATRWVFPTAKKKYLYSPHARSRSRNSNRPSISEWFNMESIAESELGSDKQVDHLRESASYIMRVIEDELKRVDGDPKRIFLGGIGQGMALALVVLLCTPHRFGGFVGVNGWIPFAEILKRCIERGNIDEAKRFFKWNVMIPIHQHSQNFAQSSRSAVSNERDRSQFGPQSTMLGLAMPEEVKQVPVLVSHASAKWLVVKTESTHAVYSLLRNIGFEQLTWDSSSCKQHKDDTPGYDSGGVAFSLVVPEQLECMIKYLKEIGMG